MSASRTSNNRISIFLGVALALFFAPYTSAQDNWTDNGTSLRMTVDDLELTIAVLDENYERRGGMMQFRFADQNISIATDDQADRMRVMIPIGPANQLDEALLFRMMQANFDSALDARYAIAQGILWSTFIHPLSSLTEEDFLSGIGQTINTAASFGSSFSSGELVFGGGDSNSVRQRELIDELLEKGQNTL